MGAALQFRNLTLGYERHPAVHHLDGAVEEGALTAVIGPNGAGKSTLCKGVVGLLKPLAGRIERFGLKPVYLTNYEMAMADDFAEFARDVSARGAGEIGMHLHAWNSPPLDPLTTDDCHYQPYLTEFPEPVMRRKIETLTAILEDRFCQKMINHRGGRWAFDDRYASILLDAGYRVDCSVTPGLSWRAVPGAPTGHGGPDYSGFPRRPYFLGADDAAAPARAGLLEVPVTSRVSDLYRAAPWLYGIRFVRGLAYRASPAVSLLCPVQPALRAPVSRHLEVMVDVARRERRVLPRGPVLRSRRGDERGAGRCRSPLPTPGSGVASSLFQLGHGNGGRAASGGNGSGRGGRSAG